MATSTQQGDTLTEDEIDRLKLPKAVSLCKKYGIDLSGKPKLHMMKWLLKNELLCKDTSRREAIDSLDRNANIDVDRRAALIEIYDNTISNVETIMKMNDPVVTELQKLFPKGCQTLEDTKIQISNSQAPVLVLGETGSGKSSFINLLLGQNILPCSILSNTHVVCEIRHNKDERPWVVMQAVVGENEDKIIRDEGDSEAFRDELSRCVQAVENGKPVYQKALIYLACDILKSGLTIVDSPGIGESKYMEDLVLDYILNACTFIYIIDTTSAGGMQARMQELVHKVYQKAMEEEREYRPESALFICNKWDGVPYDERSEVWEDTVKKITNFWPNCAKSQIFKFSTLESTFIQEKGGLSPNFTLILKEINKLVPLGREILVMRGFSFMQSFAEKCLHCFGAHLRSIELSGEDRAKKQSEATERLNTLKSQISYFFDEQNKFLKDQISIIARNLKEFISKKQNMESVCKFSDNDLPRGKEWKDVSIAVRAHVYSELMTLIRIWEEEEKQFKKIGDKISEKFAEEFPKFHAEIYAAQKELSGHSNRNASQMDDEDDDTLVPNFLRNKFKGLNFGTKVAVGIGLAPVLFVGTVVNLPVYGFKTLKRTISSLKMESNYKKSNSKEEQLKLCEKYAKSTVESITDKLKLEQIIEDDIQPLFVFIRKQRKGMEIQIKSDLDLVEKLKEEERSDEDIKRTYEPLEAKFKILKRRLKHFLFLYIPEKIQTGVKIPVIPFHTLSEMGTKKICSGLEAEIITAKLTKPLEAQKLGEFSDICVRTVKTNITSSNVKIYKMAQIAYSTIKEETIVRCLGIATDKGIMYQVLEPLQGSLRSYLTYLEDYRSNKVNTVISIMKDIVSGLKFLHEKKYVHYDISMDTVAVDMAGKPKLTNIKQVGLNVKEVPPIDSGKIIPSRFVHINPKFCMSKGAKYWPADDMYGVGVIMWEMWVGEPLVEIGKEYEVFMTDRDHFTEKRTGDGQDEDLDSSGGDFVFMDTEMLSFLKRFQPKQEPHFADGETTYDMSSMAPSKWWAMIQRCIAGEITSEEWLKSLNGYAVYPSITICDNHFQK